MGEFIPGHIPFKGSDDCGIEMEDAVNFVNRVDRKDQNPSMAGQVLRISMRTLSRREVDQL